MRLPQIPGGAKVVAVGIWMLSRCSTDSPSPRRTRSTCDAERFRTKVGRYWRSGIADVGRRPMQQVGAGASPGRRVEGGIVGKFLHVRRRQRGLIEFLQPLRLSVKDQLGAMPDQLADPFGCAIRRPLVQFASFDRDIVAF